MRGGIFPPFRRPGRQARVQNGKKGEEGGKANLSTLKASAAFSLPFFRRHVVSPSRSFYNIHFPLFPSILCQTETSPIVLRKLSAFPRETALPIFGLARCHDSVCFLPSGVSNAVRLAVAPIKWMAASHTKQMGPSRHYFSV